MPSKAEIEQIIQQKEIYLEALKELIAERNNISLSSYSKEKRARLLARSDARIKQYQEIVTGYNTQLNSAGSTGSQQTMMVEGS